MTISAKFGTCRSAINVLNKTTSVGSAVSCVVKDAVNVEAPYLIVDADSVSDTDNWCEISTFGRSYWITVEDLPGSRKGVQCQVDALASFKSQIESLPVYAARNEHTPQSYMYDTELPQESQMYVDYYTFSGSLPEKSTSADSMRYLLILK